MQRIIDSHIHACPINNPIERIKKELREAKIEEAVLIPWVRDEALEGEGFERANRYVLEIAKAEKEMKFYPYCSISRDLKLPENHEEFYGAKWHCLADIYHSGWDWSEVKQLIERIYSARLNVLIEDKFELVCKFISMCPADLTIIIPHMGIHPHYEAGGLMVDLRVLGRRWKILKGLKNVYFDTALSSAVIIQDCIGEVGLTRVLHGSDSPFGSIQRELMQTDFALIKPYEKRAILYENASRILKK
ncbi:MAG: amidohydrolase family protein [Methanocellales archaeon]